MASLTGQQINNTYDSLIKIEDNGPITGTPKNLTDGLGNQAPIQVGASGVNFPSGTVNFTGATVVGLSVPPGATGPQGAQGTAGINGATGATGAQGVSGAQGFTGATGLGSTGATGEQGDIGFTGATGSGATGPQGPTGATGTSGAQGFTGATGAAGSGGLVNGTGTYSLKSADSLTDPATPNVASFGQAIAIGNNVQATAQQAIVLGNDGAKHSGLRGIRIGAGQDSQSTDTIVIGSYSNDHNVSQNESVLIGVSNTTFDSKSVIVGQASNTFNGTNIKIGNGGNCEGPHGIGIGYRPFNGLMAGPYGVSIGYQARVTGTSATNAVVIGNEAVSHTAYSVALGSNSLVGPSGTQGIAVGYKSNAAVPNAVALGPNITASTADYTTTRRLQLVDYASLNYADDTAAAAGGVPLGGLYHNNGAARIRIV